MLRNVFGFLLSALAVPVMLLTCAHPNYITSEDDKGEDDWVTMEPKSNNDPVIVKEVPKNTGMTTVSGSVSGSSNSTVSIIRPEKAYTLSDIQNNVLATTKANGTDFTITFKDCPDCILAAYAYSGDNLSAFSSIPVREFSGNINIKGLSLSKRTGVEKVLSVQKYIQGKVFEFADEKWSANYDHCQETPVWVPKIGTYLFHLVACSNVLGGSGQKLNPSIGVTPSVGYKSAGTLLDESGSGFSPDSYVMLYFYPQDGTKRDPVKRYTDANGNFKHFYGVTENTAVGKWVYQAEDPQGLIVKTTFEIRN